MNETTFFRSSCFFRLYHSSRESRRMKNWDVHNKNNNESESANRYIVQPPLTSTVDDSKVRSSDFIKILYHLIYVTYAMQRGKSLVWTFERLFSFWADVSMTYFGKLENGKLSACICKQIRKEVYMIAPFCVIFILLSIIQIFFKMYDFL